MIKKQQVQNILKINGATNTSSDDEIRSILLSARYNNDEVDTAIMVLRENTVTNETKVQALHKVFRSDSTLTPSEINKLLGVDVELDEITRRSSRKREPSFVQYIILFILAGFLAAFSMVWAMQISEVGPFHPSANKEKSR